MALDLSNDVQKRLAIYNQGSDGHDNIGCVIIDSNRQCLL